ncbi:MAG: hypothetical protein R3C28_13915 [Pirellulaceae bacterium]
MESDVARHYRCIPRLFQRASKGASCAGIGIRTALIFGKHILHSFLQSDDKSRMKFGRHTYRQTNIATCRITTRTLARARTKLVRLDVKVPTNRRNDRPCIRSIERIEETGRHERLSVFVGFYRKGDQCRDGNHRD